MAPESLSQPGPHRERPRCALALDRIP